MIPLKDLPRNLIDRKVEVYQEFLERKILIPLYKYFIAVWFVDVAFQNDYIEENINYMVNQTGKLANIYQNIPDQKIEAKESILINLSILGIYEKHHQTKHIDNRDLAVPEFIWDRYFEFKSILTTGRYNNKALLYQGLNIFNGDNRYKFIVETEPALLENIINSKYGKIVYPNLIKEPKFSQDTNKSDQTSQDKGKDQGDGDNGGEDGQDNKEIEGKDQGKTKTQSKEYNSSDKCHENNSILSIFNDKSGYKWNDLELVFNVIESEVKVTFKPNQKIKKYNIYEDLEFPSKGKNNPKPTKATSYFYQILIEGLPKNFKNGLNEKYTSSDRKNLYTINTKLKKAFGLSNNPIERKGQGFLIKFDHNVTGLENNYKQLEQGFDHRKNKVEYDDNIDYKDYKK
jgi:hypothetical protein